MSIKPDLPNYEPTLQDYVEYTLFRCISSWIRSRPLQAALSTHRWLADLWFDRLKIRKNVTIDNLKHAFPEKSSAETERLAKKVFIHFSRLAVEHILMPKLLKNNLEDIFRNANWRELDSVLNEGRGVVLVGGHIGNWELLGSVLATRGYPVWAVATNQRNQMVDRLINEHRDLAGIKIISREESKTTVPQILHSGEIIILLSDQDAGRNGVFVSFFNRPASTPAGAAVYSLRYQAPIVYMASYYRNGKYDICFDHLQMEQSNDFNHKKMIFLLTKKHVDRLEKDVRRYPEQWFWMHRRWKTTPDEAEIGG